MRSGIPANLVVELRNLSTKIKDINRNYSTGPLSSMNVKNLTKVEILNLLLKKEAEIEEEVFSSKAETLFRIFNLSSEYISPISKKRLRILAQKEIDSLFAANSSYSKIIGEKKQIIDRWKRRYIKLEKNSLRREEVLKYLSDEASYRLPVKL